MSIITFKNGNQSSASDVSSTLEFLQSVGSTNLTNLNSIYSTLLTEFQNRLSAINSKSAILAKIPDEGSLCKFSLADFSMIDQSQTTATIRIDTQTATTLESTTNTEASVKTVTFASNVGSVQVLDQDYNIYRVSNTNNKTPTGVYSIVLNAPVNLSALVFDLSSLAGSPTIDVSVSQTGVSYSDCTSYSLNVYRLVAYFLPSIVQYIKLTITPSQPDNLGGDLYSFGLTDFTGNSTVFRALSEFVSTSVVITPTSPNYVLVANNDPNLIYYLSVDAGNYIEITPGQILSFSGMTSHSYTGLTYTGSLGQLETVVLPGDFYPDSLSVVEQGTNTTLPIIYGPTTSDANIGLLVTKYACISSNDIFYYPYNSDTDSAKLFTVKYYSGPASYTVQLKVSLSSPNPDSSPIFTGAEIQQV